MKGTVLLLDLDGTLTRRESLPYVAECLGLSGAMLVETRRATHGHTPYRESLAKRIDILGGYPIAQVAELIRRIPLHERLLTLAQRYADCCAVVTSNLDLWCAPLMADLGLTYYSSEASISTDGRVSLGKLLDKASVVAQYQAEGYRTVYVGDGVNDYDALRQVDVAIAVGLIDSPAPCLLEVCQYVETEEDSLCALLEILMNEQQTR